MHLQPCVCVRNCTNLMHVWVIMSLLLLLSLLPSSLLSWLSPRQSWCQHLVWLLCIPMVIIAITVIPMANMLSTPAGILRRTSIELGSGTVSFDVSLLSDLTGQQRAIMTNLQVYTCISLCLGHMTQVALQVRVMGSCGCQGGPPFARHCNCYCAAQLQHMHAETCWPYLHAATTEQIFQALPTSSLTGHSGIAGRFIKQIHTIFV